MKRELAILITLCILLGTGFASLDNQPELSDPSGETGTRAVPPILIDSDITSDTIWDDTALTYRVSRRVWVLEGATLTIRPGVVVRFDQGAGLHVMGGIIVEGERLDPVYFIPYSSNPSPMHWVGLSLENNTGQCIIDYAIIRFSEYGIACRGGEASITNSTIEYAHYFGVMAGENSTVLIRNNFINFTTWVGVMTDNRSSARVEYNHIQTSNHGILCYDVAEVTGNDIIRCWVGILAWGDALITLNQVRDCMDGIQSFHASPILESNLIVSCDGNGTRFINSNAILRNNTLVYNNVGIDLDYRSKHLLESMENNLVNGMDIRDFFFVGEHDLVLDNLFLDSGRSNGYYGSYTAQGSVTLYDCRNVTIRDSSILHSANAVFATNSTFRIYNTDLGDASRFQIFLEANATGSGFNRSVDPDSVMIGGDNCLFQTFDDLQVQVRDYQKEPILGARVFVRESQLVLHDATTNVTGLTPVMVVKDRTVSDAGVISSPINVEVLVDGYNFGTNPRTGIYVNQTDFITFTDLGDIFPPEILALSIRDGNRSFPVDGTIRIQFSEPMNQTSAENAFSITGNATGTFTWDGFNMTFIPDNLEHDTYYTVVISADARDLSGNGLDSPISFSFTTEHPPRASSYSMIYVVLAIFAIAAMAGFLFLRKLK